MRTPVFVIALALIGAAIAIWLAGCSSAPQDDPHTFNCGDGNYIIPGKQQCPKRTWYNPGPGFYDGKR
jgi:hypothetical protein